MREDQLPAFCTLHDDPSKAVEAGRYGVGRAVAFVAPREAQLIETEEGPVRAGEVAGRTLVSLISPGTELTEYSNGPQEGDPTSGSGAAEPHSIPGYAAVFRIEERGADVRHLDLGQVVYAMGAHRSWQQHSVDTVRPLPADLDPAVAVYARIAGISMTTLMTTSARPPGPVLVSGLGLVGNLAAQVFQIAGYDVVATDPLQSRVDLARSVGVSGARIELDSSWPRGFALALECSGHEDAALQGCRLVREGGEVVLVGVPWRQRSDTSAHAILNEVFQRYVHLRSGWEWELPTAEIVWRAAGTGRPASEGSVIGNQGLALRWLAERKLRVEGLGVEVSPLRAQESYQALLRQEGALTRAFSWRSEQGD